MARLSHHRIIQSKLRCICFLASFSAVVVALVLWSVSDTKGKSFEMKKEDDEVYPPKMNPPTWNLRYDPPEKTFYDDPEMEYSLETPMRNWNEKRREWLRLHASFLPGTSERIVMVTGSQPEPCKSPNGDHLLLRLLPKMTGYWAKYAAVKAAMIAHPEAQWIWWVDSDAVITDMEFRPPLERYKGFKLVLHGWKSAIMEDRSWTGLNAGVFLIRNCQWSMDFVSAWASMGPMGKDYRRWGAVQRSIFKDKMFPDSDDQSSLSYLLYKNPSLIGDTVYLEGEYYLQGYWIGMLPKLENATAMYEDVERVDRKLRRRRAEKVMTVVGELREPYLAKAGVTGGNWKRPFVTHFTGCQPCSGDRNPSYSENDCQDGIVKALNFADNQVLKIYGFMKPDLLDSDTVVEVPFDYPLEGPFGRR